MPLLHTQGNGEKYSGKYRVLKRGTVRYSTRHGMFANAARCDAQRGTLSLPTRHGAFEILAKCVFPLSCEIYDNIGVKETFIKFFPPTPCPVLFNIESLWKRALAGSSKGDSMRLHSSLFSNKGVFLFVKGSLMLRSRWGCSSGSAMSRGTSLRCRTLLPTRVRALPWRGRSSKWLCLPGGGV